MLASELYPLRHLATADHECATRVVPIKGSNRGISVVSQKGSTWNRRLNMAVMHMTNSGESDRIFKTWFKDQQCTRSVKFYQLGLQEIGNLFVWLCYCVSACLFIMLVLALWTFFIRFWRKRKEQQDRHEEE